MNTFFSRTDIYRIDIRFAGLEYVQHKMSDLIYPAKGRWTVTSGRRSDGSASFLPVNEPRFPCFYVMHLVYRRCITKAPHWRLYVGGNIRDGTAPNAAGDIDGDRYA